VETPNSTTPPLRSVRTHGCTRLVARLRRASSVPDRADRVCLGDIIVHLNKKLQHVGRISRDDGGRRWGWGETHAWG
jgi:hypothetical protein